MSQQSRSGWSWNPFLHIGNRKSRRGSQCIAQAAGATIEPLEQRRLLTVFTVTNTGDDGGSDPAPGAGNGTLRQAIVDSNNDAGPNTIDFSIGTGAQTISLAGPLPATETPVTIDGTSQPGYSGTPLITLDGTSAGASVDGLDLDDGNSTIKGMIFIKFTGNGIDLSDGNGDSVVNCYIGTNSLNAVGLGNGGDGIDIRNGGDTIGGAAATERNIISGNGGNGITIDDSNATPMDSGNNSIEGNYIGTNIAGNFALPNTGHGVYVTDSSGDTIGGSARDDGNLISGNTTSGIFLDAGATGISVQANFIGTSIITLNPLPNGSDGITDQSDGSITIGGATPGMGNVISGNTGKGIDMVKDANETILGNYIGVNLLGTAMGNGGSGIAMDSDSNATIGGSDSGDGNVISANSGDGVNIGGSTGSDSSNSATIEGNIIGLDPMGTSVRSNADGIDDVTGSVSIGGAMAADRNIISGNIDDGIEIGKDNFFNFIYGNYIGIDKAGDGTHAVGNKNGIEVDLNAEVIIGGPSTGQGNLISGNSRAGILDDGTTDVSFLTVRGNYIGTDVTGTSAVGNSIGISITNLNRAVIGGSSPGDGNLISGNLDGLEMDSSSSCLIEGNRIGTDAAGNAALAFPQPNFIQQLYGVDELTGIDIEDGSDANRIGGSIPAAGNIIAFSANGVQVDGDEASSNSVENSIRLNTFFSNGALGLDGGIVLGSTDNFNDPGDTDTGPNDLQNFPVLTPALAVRGGVLTPGTLNSTPNSQFIIDYYYGSHLDTTGNSEAENYLGSITVTTDANGNATFAPTFLVNVPVGDYIDATATTTAYANGGDTSEFSGPVQVTAPAPPTPTNHSPVAKSDSASIKPATPVTINVLSNDSDPDGNSLTVSEITAAPADGTASISSNKIIYTPNTLFDGTDSFTYKISDGHGGTATAKVTVVVGAGAGVGKDPNNSADTALIIYGTPNNDTISVNYGGSQGKASVILNGANQGTFSFTGGIYIYGLAGNDGITVASQITRSAWIWGGDGNDTVNGGGGNDFVFGQAGNDSLLGNAGRDILIGGDGADNLSGGSGDDVLIAGDFKTTLTMAQLASIQKEWIRTDKNYSYRVNHLTIGGGYNTINLNSSTLFSSTPLKDTLTGGADSDLFFASTTGDNVTDKSSIETKINIG